MPLLHFSFSDEHHTACVSGREGGVSVAPYDTANLSFGVGDDPAAVVENRSRLCAMLGEPLDSLTVANQVHSGDVVIISAAQRGRGARTHADAVANADALVTATPGILLAVVLADCVPVALVDPVRHVVAVAHAGWRGTVAHVTANTVATMVEHFGCDPIDIRAGIGPSIGPASYDVGADVILAVGDAFPNAPEVLQVTATRTTFDLWAANRQDLLMSGVLDHHIETSGIDVRAESDRYFSHRAARPTGRFMALVMLADRGSGATTPHARASRT